jgi:dTMP kinase
MRGRFITFEGGQGAGKSTQIERLGTALRRAGRKIVVTREPGGTAWAEEIRTLLLRGDSQKMTALTQALLHNAARQEHLHEVIRPTLLRGDWVLCDRFMDSTRAYQGAALGADQNVLEILESLVVADAVPDLTLILDLPPEAGLKRVSDRAVTSGKSFTGYEQMTLSLHNRLREAFLAIARAEPERCMLINACQSIDKVSEDIWQAVNERLKP